MIFFRGLCVLGLMWTAVALPMPVTEEGSIHRPYTTREPALVFPRGRSTEDLKHAAKVHDKAASASDGAAIAASLTRPQDVQAHVLNAAVSRLAADNLRGMHLPHPEAVAVGAQQAIVAMTVKQAADKDHKNYVAGRKTL